MQKFALFTLLLFSCFSIYSQGSKEHQRFGTGPNLIKFGLVEKLDGRFRYTLDYERYLTRYLSIGAAFGYHRTTRGGAIGNFFHVGFEGRYYFGLQKSERFRLFLAAYAGYDREEYRYNGGLALRYGSELGAGFGTLFRLTRHLRIDGVLMPGYEPLITREGKDSGGVIYSRNIIRHFITIYGKIQIGYSF